MRDLSAAIEAQFTALRYFALDGTDHRSHEEQNRMIRRYIATATTLRRLESDGAFDEAQLAAAAFLARYSGRTLHAYRQDLRAFFQWSADAGLTTLAATRPHMELYRAAYPLITDRPSAGVPQFVGR